MIDLMKLRACVYAAESLSFSKAARRWHVTQPTISHHIRSLEESLEAGLFTRSGHTLKLIEAGRLLLPFAHDLLRQASRLHQAYFADGLILIVLPGHPWADRQFIEPADLLEEHLIIRESTSGTRRIMLTELAKHGITFDDLNNSPRTGQCRGNRAHGRGRIWRRLRLFPISRLGAQDKACGGRARGWISAQAHGVYGTPDTRDTFPAARGILELCSRSIQRRSIRSGWATAINDLSL
jgi:DNA-binding transcriptional LysR family regulator